MPKNQITRHSFEHGLSHELAGKAARKAWMEYSKQYKGYIKGRWDTPTSLKFVINAMIYNLSGRMTVEETIVRISVNQVPFLLRTQVAIAIRTIEAEAQKWIARAKAGELDE